MKKSDFLVKNSFVKSNNCKNILKNSYSFRIENAKAVPESTDENEQGGKRY